MNNSFNATVNAVAEEMEVREYRKKSYVITAELVPEGTKLHNFLEDAYYTTNSEKCVKLTGLVGETWPVTIDKLVKTYSFEDGTPISRENIPSGPFKARTVVGKKAETVFAARTNPHDQLEVKTSWGDVLLTNADGVPHGEGDYIVYANRHGSPDVSDQWVVNGLIFLKTYEEVKK